MKKVYILSTLLMTAVLLVGCGGEKTEEAPKKATTESTESTKTEATNDAVYFKDNVAQLIDVKLEITETKVIQPGEVGNEYGEKPVFAIWYKATNLTGKDIDPGTAWIAVFEAIQDNDPNRVNTLDVGALPDDRFLDTQLETIKKGGTVEHAIAYELDDLTTPVTLVASQGIGGKKLGEQTFEIAE